MSSNTLKQNNWSRNYKVSKKHSTIFTKSNQQQKVWRRYRQKKLKKLFRCRSRTCRYSLWFCKWRQTIQNWRKLFKLRKFRLKLCHLMVKWSYHLWISPCPRYMVKTRWWHRVSLVRRFKRAFHRGCKFRTKTILLTTSEESSHWRLMHRQP